MKTITLMLMAFFTCFAAQAGDLNSYTGDYSEPGTANTCAALTHVEMNAGNMMIETETCVDRNTGSLMGVFTCEDTTMTCRVNANFPQNICPSASLLLLSSGNILMSNPCFGISNEWIRTN